MKTKDLTKCAILLALIALGSKLRIPLDMIGMNFTLQWLFVLLTALILSKNQAMLTIGVYLLLGLIGLPIFAKGGGLWYLSKPTFGFLLGFLLSVYVIHIVKGNNITKTIAGLISYYLCGFVYYLFMMNVIYQSQMGIALAFINCFTTIIPDLLLCFIACGLYKRLKYVIK